MLREQVNRSGFTLLEITIALFVLSIGLVTVFTLFPIGILAVKDVVDGTRGAILADTARGQLVADQVHLTIMNSSSKFFSGNAQSMDSKSFVAPSGPFYYPFDLRYFPGPIYMYQDAAGDLVRRVRFDDRTMVPLKMRGLFTGGHSVEVVEGSVNRDCQRLKYFVDGGGDFTGWQMLLRVRGRDYLLAGCDFSDVTPALFRVDGDGAELPSIDGETTFEVRVPVAMKEPPVDVPQQWTCATADFSGPGPFDIVESASTRSLWASLCPAGWVSVDGDWFRVTSVAADKIDLDAAEPLPRPSKQRFDVVLPVVDFGAADFDGRDPSTSADDVQYLPILRSGDAVAGNAQQLAFFETGAWVEIVVDGALGEFDPVNSIGPSSVKLVDPADHVNPSTEPLIIPGNYIRVGGEDYEIARGIYTDSGQKYFDIVGSVPALAQRHFRIVIGYDPVAHQVPEIARFPVVDVTRDLGSDPVTGERPIVACHVGRDGNGNLPQDLFPVGFGAAAHPVHVLPRNNSQFSYQVSLTQKSIAGDFNKTKKEITAPDTPATPMSPAMPGVPYPVDPVLCGMVNPVQVAVYRMFVPPAGKDLNPNWHSNYAVNSFIQKVEDGGAKLKVHPILPFSAKNVSFYMWDSNVPTETMLVGVGRYVNAGGPKFAFDSITENAILITPGAYVRLEWTEGGKTTQTDFTLDDTANPSLGYIAWPGGSKPKNGTTTVRMSYLALDDTKVRADGNPPRGRGAFVRGSNIVRSFYPYQWNSMSGVSFDYPSMGFPESRTLSGRSNIEVGDYIEPPDEESWYTVVGISQNPGAGVDYLILDRPYTGDTEDDFSFTYVTPMNKTFRANVTIFRSYALSPLPDAAGATTSARAAAFGYDADGDLDTAKRSVVLAVPLPVNIKPGDYIRAEGDMATEIVDQTGHNATQIEEGLGDDSDGDLHWYMIEAISADRTQVTLAAPYEGFMQEPDKNADPTRVFQPASISTAVVKSFNMLIGAM